MSTLFFFSFYFDFFIQLEIMLKKIAPIIMNCQKKTAIPSWELDDYMQEGMIIITNY
jgi:hypothetical protein